MKKSYTTLLFSITAITLIAQPTFNRVDTVKVKIGASYITNPWAGGHNLPQFSAFDFNGDGIKDLFVFDKTGNKVTTYLNSGTANTVAYTHAPQYQAAFEALPLTRFCLIRDYNCDGKEDIFTYQGSIAGIKVYKNITTVPGNLQFQLAYNLLYTKYPSTSTNLYVSPVDVPAVRDMDNDGDLDVLSFDVSGTKVEYHKNMSIENGWGCDSLKFTVDKDCWGLFTEDIGTNSAFINQSACETVRLIRPDSALNSLHSGSCLECFDENNDGDKEAVIGDVSFTSIYKVRNGGTPTLANIDTVEMNWPKNSAAVNLNLFPCPFHIDVNNDGARDMLVSPSAANVSENQKSIWYYKNTGTELNPIFTFQQTDLLQDNMIDAGEGAYPVFFDFDNDGLLDIIIGNYGYFTSPGNFTSKLTACRNTGTATKPEFTLTTTDYANLTVALPSINNLHPTFGDLDGDGDKDMMVGEYNGYVHYFENTAAAGNPANFVLTNYRVKDDAGDSIDVGQFSAPQLFDVNKDGKLDLLIGEQSGTLNYYENVGTTAAAQWSLISVTFGGVDVSGIYSTGYSAPFMYNDSGIYELLVGTESGYLWRYNNIDGNLAGNFTRLDSTFNNIYEGIRSSPTMADVTNDGLLDLVVGNYRGGLAFYIGDMSVGIAESSQQFPDFLIYPNPNQGKFSLQLPAGSVQSRNTKIEITNMLGQKIYSALVPLPLGGQGWAIDISNLPNGVYTCKLTNGKIARIKKLVLEKE